jgi:hypothetical protein
VIELPIKTVSTLNVREHWAVRAKRNKTHRNETHWACKGLKRVDPPMTITLTRLGKRKLDGDNLQGALKSVRDGVADWLGIDDGDDRLTWVYRQETGAYGVRIEIEKELENEQSAI